MRYWVAVAHEFHGKSRVKFIDVVITLYPHKIGLFFHTERCIDEINELKRQLLMN